MYMVYKYRLDIARRICYWWSMGMDVLGWEGIMTVTTTTTHLRTLAWGFFVLDDFPLMGVGFGGYEVGLLGSIRYGWIIFRYTQRSALQYKSISN